MASEADLLKNFIVDNFLYGDRDVALAADDSFSERGIVDSTGILELVAFVETSFGISVADEEIVPENFDSIQRLMFYLNRKRSGATRAG